ncbi:UNVERIFIED_CONTAM: hypothetical protein Sradi_5885600, partial [Sesamum radiatum]
HLGHAVDECYEKLKNRGLVRPFERDDQRASDHADLRKKLDAQRAERELHTRQKGKRVVFKDVDRHPGASSSGAEGTEDGGVEMELHDTVLPAGMPEPMLHEEVVDGGTEKDIPILQSPPDVCQRVADVATCSLEPPVPEEPLPQDSSPGRILNRVRKQHYLDFLAIMEPMVSIDGQFMVRRLGFLDVVSNCGNQIWFFWGPDVRCQVLVDREQLLHVRLESNKWPKPLFVTAVYAKCDTVERRALWDALRAVLVGASPWIVGGDFNTVLSPDERSGGSAPSGIAMSNFHYVIADSALVDAGYVGSPYTWYSRRLHQRLDRVLISNYWITVFPKMQFLGVVRRNWQYWTVGSGMMRLQQKLTHLKHCLKEWNKTVFGNVFDKVAAAERGLKEADEAYDQDPCDRTLWSAIGVLLNPIAIKDSAASFFQWLLTAEPVFLEEMDSEHLEDGLTDEDRRSLCVMLTLEEVREAVFSIDLDSVAGPDGFGAIFFHTCWEIISDDVFGAVTEFFRGVEMPKGFTATTISLIPKTSSPTCWSEYRPISLCNSGFVPGRLLSDNVLLAQELVHSLESRRLDANVVFKLDMAKAYNRISWEFLYQVLRQKGFPQRWISLVANAVSHCWLGSALYGAPDDILSGTWSDSELLRELLRLSGQLINGSKSSFIVGRQASSLQMQAVQDVLGYQLKYLPVTYLGVPLYKGNRKAYLFDSIISRLRDMLQGWAMTNLSRGGRLALIRSVLQATPLHLLQACFPMAEGGLGVRSLADYVRAFSMKLWWRFWGKSSLWLEYLHGRYCRNLHPTIVPYNRNHSSVGIAFIAFEMWPSLFSSGHWVKVLFLFGTIIGLARSP